MQDYEQMHAKTNCCDSGGNREQVSVSGAPRKNHLWSSPVVFPFYRTYDVLRQSSAACKALKVLKSGVLKRLASRIVFLW
jgi:hypothetical protein